MNILLKYGASERFFNEATLYPKHKLARIISQHKGLYRAVSENGEFFAELSGKLIYNTVRLEDYPTVGDFVMLEENGTDSPAIIHHILTRKSEFKRTAVGVSNQTQVIAANIDIVFICMSLNSNYNLSRLERYLSISWDSNAIPVILLTKSDLCESTGSVLTEIEKTALGTDIILTSAINNDVSEKLNKYLKCGVTASFIGSSGVGKSTLINRLLAEESIATRDIDKNDKGRHTTTSKEMILLPNGAVVIDTPGIREIGVESVNLEKSFSDIDELSYQCKFHDCTHTNEPGCAVTAAIKEGILDERRLQNYIKIKREAKYDGMSSRQIENEKFNEMFREVGGLKGANKFKKQLKKSNKYKF